jgi:RHS repeat-associated protein
MKRFVSSRVLFQVVLNKLSLPALLFLSSLAVVPVGPVAVLGAVGMMAVPAVAHAQPEPPCDPSDPTDDDGDGDGCPVGNIQKAMGNPKAACNCYTAPQGSTGDPVDNATGNLYSEESDWQGSGPFPLEMKRSYNSLFSVAANESYSAMGNYVSPVGTDWIFSYGAQIVFTAGPAPTKVMALRPDGQVLNYKLINGVWASDADINESLTEQTNASGAPAGWILVTEELATERYDATGRLLSITNRAGFTQTLSYSTSATPPAIAPTAGLLIAVTDSVGRALHFTWNTLGHIVTATAPDGGVTSYAYNYGNLTAVTHADGSARQYLYQAGGGQASFLTGVTDELGQPYASYTYDRNYNNVTHSTLTGGADATTFVFGGSTSYSTRVTDALSAARVYNFDSIVSRFRNTSVQTPCLGCANPLTTNTYAYNNNGYLTAITQIPGDSSVPENTAFTWDAAHNLMLSRTEAVGTPSARTITTRWNPALRLPLSRTVSDATGTTSAATQWVYNTRGQPLARCEIDAAKAGSYACASSGTAPAGVRRWTHTYCDAIDSTQCPVVGLIRSTTGPRTDVTQTTSSSYYMDNVTSGCSSVGGACHQAGDLHQVVDALGHPSTVASYDGAGRPTRLIDVNAVHTDLTYNSRGWLASRSVAGATTSMTYKPYGAVESITDPDHITTTFTYDAAHRLTDITDAQGNDIHYTLDAAGNKLSEQTRNAAGTVVRSLSRSYNALGQITAVIDGLSHTVFNAGDSGSYDANGNLVHSADALGIARQQGFDALNRLNSVIANYNGTDAATKNAQTALHNDALDRLDGVTDPDGLDTIYTYDGLSNRTELSSPDTGISNDTYDAAGNLLTHTDAKGIVSTSNYDVLNRLVGTSYLDSTLNVGYHYDEPDTATSCTASYPVGRLTRVVEQAISTVYCYDARGNVTQKSQTQGTTTDTIHYTYTLADRLSSQINASGNLVQYSRDTDGRISAITLQTPAGTRSAVSAVSYLPFGPISSYTLGNGQTVTRSHDANYAVTDVVSPAFNLHLGRDAMGSISALGNTPGASPATETYGYDALYRLKDVTDGTATLESYSYNKTGDRLSKTASGLGTGAYGYTSGTHQLASIGNAPRVNDANGNTTASVMGAETFSFGYNGRNRPTVAQRNGQTVGTYTYNAFGQRIAKVATSPSAVTERYVYNEASQLIGEYGTIVRDYVWLGDIPVALVDAAGGFASCENCVPPIVDPYVPPGGGGASSFAMRQFAFNSTSSSANSVVNYVTADQLGTPRAVSDQSGSVIWQWAYAGNPFGEQLPTSATGYVLNLRYPGQYFDAETNTDYNVFRTYEPATGRYLQSDLIGLGGGLSTYGYVRSNPLLSVDARGLDVAVVVDNNTVPIFGRFGGHVGVLVGSNNSGWDYYSKDAFVNGVQKDTHATYRNLDDFFNSQGDRYKTGEVFDTSFEQDAKMKRWASGHLNDEFHGISNNCADFAYGVLKAGDLRVDPPTMFISIPNDMLDTGSGRIDWSQSHHTITPQNYQPDLFVHGYW